MNPRAARPAGKGGEPVWSARMQEIRDRNTGRMRDAKERWKPLPPAAAAAGAKPRFADDPALSLDVLREVYSPLKIISANHAHSARPLIREQANKHKMIEPFVENSLTRGVVCRPITMRAWTMSSRFSLMSIPRLSTRRIFTQSFCRPDVCASSRPIVLYWRERWNISAFRVIRSSFAWVKAPMRAAGLSSTSPCSSPNGKGM